jgi:hypothetical protein
MLGIHFLTFLMTISPPCHQQVKAIVSKISSVIFANLSVDASLLVKWALDAPN